MRAMLPLLLIGLAACDSAGPGFRGVEPVTRSVDGSTFTLRTADSVTEAIRTSREWLPDFYATARRAALAAEQVNPACRAAWVEGDPAMMRVGLACQGAPAPQMKTRSRLTCRVVHDPYKQDIIRCRDS